MTEIRNRFEENPTDFELISQLLSAILSCEKHPLTEQLKVYQDSILDRLQPLVCKRMSDIEKVKVPLSEDLYKHYKAKRKQSAGEEAAGEKNESVDSSVETADSDVKERESDADTDNVPVNLSERSEMETSEKEVKEDDKEEEDEIVDDNDGTSQEQTGIINAVEETRKEIETAEAKCDKLRKKLEAENESLALYKAGEYDKYNQENMDDLFDEDDEEESEMGDEENSKMEPVNEAADTEAGISSDEFDGIRAAAYKRHLKGIVEDILTSIEQMAVLFVVVYDKLDSAEGKDHCNAELEASFFRPLWKYLLVLFRLSNASEELKLAAIMTDKQNCDPAELAVRDKLCLTPPTGSSSYPYEAAITELHSVVTFHTMLEKLECIVRTSKLVMQCVEHYYTNMNTQAPSIGADDLVPVLCYVVVRSGLPQIVSECQAVERFLHEGYMFGEEGYCLTSFQTAIDYLTSTRWHAEP